MIICGQYAAGLAALGVTPSAERSWAPIEFPATSDINDEFIVRTLASRGITTDEASDAGHFAYSWLSDTQLTKSDPAIRQLIADALASRNHDTAQPWPTDMQYAFNEAHGRWVPVVPVTADVTSHIANVPMEDDTPSSSGGTNATPQENTLVAVLSTPTSVDAALTVDPPSEVKPSRMEVDEEGETAEGS